MSPSPIVSAEMTASKASPLNGRSDGGSVVDVVVAAAVVDVDVDAVVDVCGGSVVAGAVVVDALVVGAAVVVGSAAVSSDELVAAARATTAMPAAPIIHALLAMAPLSLLVRPILRHPTGCGVISGAATPGKVGCHA
jgi:hypothetical protein